MHTQQPAILNICIHIYSRHLLHRPHPTLKCADIKRRHLNLVCVLARLSVSVAPLLKSNHKILVFTRKMLSSVPIFTFQPNFSCAGKYLIYEPVSLDSV